MRFFLIIAFFVLGTSFSAPFFASAAEGINNPSAYIAPSTSVTNTSQTSVTNTGSSVTLINPLKAGTSLESFLRDILSFVIRIGTIVVILMLVFVGFKFVTARGVPGKIAAAREMLLWTVIGALVLLGAQAISLGIQATVQSLGG